MKGPFRHEDDKHAEHEHAGIITLYKLKTSLSSTLSTLYCRLSKLKKAKI